MVCNIILICVNDCILTCHFWFCLHQSKLFNATIYITQQPNPTQQSIFRSVTKGSTKKKGKQWTADKFLAVQYIPVLSQLLSCSLKAQHENNQTPHNNQPPPGSTTVRWGWWGKFGFAKNDHYDQIQITHLCFAFLILSYYIVLLLKDTTRKQPNPTQQSATSRVDNC